jgi:hypothetical protein
MNFAVQLLIARLKRKGDAKRGDGERGDGGKKNYSP